MSLSALPVVIVLHPAVVVDDAELGHGRHVEGHQAQAHGGHHGLDKHIISLFEIIDNVHSHDQNRAQWFFYIFF